jgi:enamine deaminase RidA (YjgF/YER057c/UK114 family)
MNDGYRPVFPTDPPVRATVGIGKLAGQNALVEVMVTAVK